MKIVIDARMYNESGIGRYIRNLIGEMEKIDKDNEYFILHLKKDFEKLPYEKNFYKVLANFKWYGMNEQLKLPKILGSLKPDLVHFPHFNVPIFYRGKFMVTIHDLIHQHYSVERATTHGPFIYKIKQFGYKKVFQHAIYKSLKILVPSQFVKQQLIDEWGVEGGRVMVTAEAVDDKITTAVSNLSPDASRAVLDRFNIRQPYIFYIGNAHPHKNVEGLMKAFLKLKVRSKDLKLVLSGHNHYFWQKIKDNYQDKDIIYTGQISDEELVALYKNAVCFIMPSFEEGFGIPLLEAMACSCPVVSSNAGALAEVGGDACLYFDPLNLLDMVNKISKVLDSEKLRKSLVERGQKRVKLFAWDKLAKQSRKVYESCYSA